MKKVRLICEAIVLAVVVMVATVTVSAGKAKLDGGVPPPCPPACPFK